VSSGTRLIRQLRFAAVRLGLRRRRRSLCSECEIWQQIFDWGVVAYRAESKGSWVVIV